MDSPFAVRLGESGYPISRLITSRARTLASTRSDLARRLGYVHLAKAHKALAELLTTGRVPVHMSGKLAQALEIEQAIVDAVMESTGRQLRDERRARLLTAEKEHARKFQPYLRTETERNVPEPVFVAALIGTARLRDVELPPDIWETSGDGRDRIVMQAIRAHYVEHRGHVPAFGAIVAYTLVTMPGYLVDFGYPFDTLEIPQGRFSH